MYRYIYKHTHIHIDSVRCYAILLGQWHHKYIYVYISVYTYVHVHTFIYMHIYEDPVCSLSNSGRAMVS